MKEEHKCPKCNKIFRQKKEWKRHQKSCGKSFQCSHDNCNKTFTEQKNLRRHVKEKHENQKRAPEKDVECKSCNLTFSSKANLRRHNKSFHE